MSWVKRVEAVMDVLKGSGIEEIELIEGELEICLRRSPGNYLVQKVQQFTAVQRENPSEVEGNIKDVKAPLTGVYYAAPAPTDPPFIKVGDTIKAGQTIGLIEAMKVFSEIASDASGRIVAIKVCGGEVVKKGAILLQVEPL
jgi:acetyl-CoA carboxylase biotin carboxyl carrier protein